MVTSLTHFFSLFLERLLLFSMVNQSLPDRFIEVQKEPLKRETT